MTEPTMPLNNDGDEVLLIDRGGIVRSQVAYGENEVRTGQWVEFGAESDATSEPRTDQRLDNLDNDAASILRQLPGVVQVIHHGPPGRPCHRIVHLRDWHFLPKDLFAADVRDQADEPVSESEIDRLYAAFLSDVEAVQTEQRAILRCLIEHHGLRTVFQEGPTQRDMPVYRAKLRVLRKLDSEMAGLRDEHAEVARALSEMTAAGQQGTADYRDLAEVQQKIEEVLQAHRLDVLRIGVAGQLHMTGELHEVLPLDDTRLLDEADPLTEAGRVDLKPEVIEARQDAQVRKLLEAGGFAFVILGGAHDLGDNIVKQSCGCEYVVVTTREYRRAYEPDDRTPLVPHAGRSRPNPTHYTSEASGDSGAAGGLWRGRNYARHPLKLDIKRHFRKRGAGRGNP